MPDEQTPEELEKQAEALKKKAADARAARTKPVTQPAVDVTELKASILALQEQCKKAATTADVDTLYDGISTLGKKLDATAQTQKTQGGAKTLMWIIGINIAISIITLGAVLVK